MHFLKLYFYRVEQKKREESILAVKSLLMMSLLLLLFLLIPIPMQGACSPRRRRSKTSIIESAKKGRHSPGAISHRVLSTEKLAAPTESHMSHVER
jgi:hypothetical protein